VGFIAQACRVIGGAYHISIVLCELALGIAFSYQTYSLLPVLHRLLGMLAPRQFAVAILASPNMLYT